MRQLSGVDWATELEPAFRQVFAATDPFGSPFQPAVSARALLYPVSYLLDAEQFQALADVARSIGDDAICVSITETNKRLDAPDARHWILEHWEWTEYHELGDVGVLENAVYSPIGQWGMLISHEQHAVLGGSERFMQEMAARFPAFQESLGEFLTYWSENSRRHNADVDWVAPLLSHLYGESRARQVSLEYPMR